MPSNPKIRATSTFSNSKPKSKDKDKDKDKDDASPRSGKSHLSFTNWMLGGSLMTPAGSKTSLRRRRREGSRVTTEVVIEDAVGEEGDEEGKEEEEMEIVLVKRVKKKKIDAGNEEEKPKEPKILEHACGRESSEPVVLRHTCGKSNDPVPPETAVPKVVEAVVTASTAEPGPEAEAKKPEPELVIEKCSNCGGIKDKNSEAEKPAFEYPPPPWIIAQLLKEAEEKAAAAASTGGAVCKKDKGKEKADVLTPWDVWVAEENAKEDEAKEKAAEPKKKVVKSKKDDSKKDESKGDDSKEGGTASDTPTGEKDASRTDDPKDNDAIIIISPPEDNDTSKKDEGADKWTAEKDAKLLELKAKNKPWKLIAKEMAENEGELKARFKVLKPEASGDVANKGKGNENNKKGKVKKGDKKPEKAVESEAEAENAKNPEADNATGGDGDTSGGWDTVAATGGDDSSNKVDTPIEEANKTGGEAVANAGGWDVPSNNQAEASGWDAPGNDKPEASEWDTPGNNQDTTAANAGKEGQAAATTEFGGGATGEETWGDTADVTLQEKLNPQMSGANGDGNNQPGVIAAAMADVGGGWGIGDGLPEFNDTRFSWGATPKASRWGGASSRKYFVNSMETAGEKKTVSNAGGSTKSADKPVNNGPVIPTADAFASYWESQSTARPQAAPLLFPPTPVQIKVQVERQAQAEGDVIKKLQRNEIWPEDDCTVLEELMRRHTDHKWLNMQAGFFNWTGRMISAEMIEKKFKDDGAEGL